MLVLGGLLLGIGCTRPQAPGRECDPATLSPGADVVCVVPGGPGRDMLVRLPRGYDATRPTPLVVAMHGGGGQKEGMNPLTCADGDPTSPSCLSNVADREGFIVVYPDGLANRLGFRSWNHGGDAPGLHCSHACAQRSDDVGYIRAVLDEVARLANVDRARVYATGFSNGAGMSHRLACELSDRIAAIGPVAGGDQFSLSNACSPPRAVPVLAIHGTEDPCWPYDGGEGRCVAGQRGRYAGVHESMVGTDARPGWALRNGCEGEARVEALPDRDRDGRVATRTDFAGCRAAVTLLALEGGGHTWPGGDAYLDADRIGRVNRDFNASELLWAFFRQHRLE